MHGVDEHGRVALAHTVRRQQLLQLIATLPPCRVAIEFCSGAHYWARQFARFGHMPKLMAPKFVAPYRMGGQQGNNDANDAAAIYKRAAQT